MDQLIMFAVVFQKHVKTHKFKFLVSSNQIIKSFTNLISYILFV